MTKEVRSAQEIQAEVRRLIEAAASEGKANPGITVPLPERLPEADAGQCNWDMTYFGHAVLHPEAVESAIIDVKERWNMR